MSTGISAEASISIHQPVTKVWEALTHPELIKKYFFGTTTITDWQVGHPVRFVGEWQGKKYEDKGTIRAFVENEIIRYDYWSSMSGIEDKPENYVTVTYRLSPQSDEETILTITQDNIQSEKMRDHSVENWNTVLGGLKEMLENSKQSTSS